MMRKRWISGVSVPLVFLAIAGASEVDRAARAMGYDGALTQSPVLDPDAIEAIAQARGLMKMTRYKDAADLILPFAEDGHPVAMYWLGRLHKDGRGVRQDLEAARNWIAKSLATPYSLRPEAAYELGRLFQRAKGPNCQTIAFEWFSKSLDWGYGKAHVQLAKHYELGLGIDADIDKALYHFQRAGAAGYPTSTIRLARIVRDGQYGIRPDPLIGRFWGLRAVDGLIKKARQGSPSAAKTLGRLYRDGEFVSRDLAAAEQWFRRSAMLGDSGGMHDLGTMLTAREMTPAQFSAGMAWLKKAALHGHGGAMTALGRLHLSSRMGLQEGGSIVWFEKGIEAEHAGAMEELARLLWAGNLVGRDRARALALAEKGASLGHSGAQGALEEFRKDGANTSS